MTQANSTGRPESIGSVGVDSFFRVMVTSPWLWGGGATALFYLALPYVPFRQAEIARYFTAHWIEYVTTGLTFVGIAFLVNKLLARPAERRMLSNDVLEGLTCIPAESATQAADRMEAHLRLTARHGKQTMLVRRICEACSYIKARNTADGLDQHLNYLAEVAVSRLSDSYALLRTIIWAVPILGFLGTVIGITMAIANVTPDQLDSSLSEVTAGLAVAFDTTALSLALSMILVFGSFIVERLEHQVLDAIEDFAIRRIPSYFPASHTPADPFMAAQTQAAGDLLRATDQMVQEQVQVWRESLGQYRSRWEETANRQSESIADEIGTSVDTALVAHRELLAESRASFAEATERASIRIAEQIDRLQMTLREEADVRMKTMAETWQHVLDSQQNLQRQMAEHFHRSSSVFAEASSGLQQQLSGLAHLLGDQQSLLESRTNLLQRMIDQDDQLIQLESRLAETLQASRAADKLEDTILNLNGAIHLLTSRVTSRAA